MPGRKVKTMTAAGVAGAVLLALTLGLIGWVSWKQSAFPWQALRDGLMGFASVAPMMLLSFCLAALMTRLVPHDTLVQWLGQGSGWRGIGIATLAGVVTPGGPFVQFPIVAVLHKQGVAVGPLAAYLSAWALLGAHRFVILEVPLLGWKFSVCRFALSAVFPPTIGWVIQWVWRRWLT